MRECEWSRVRGRRHATVRVPRLWQRQRVSRSRSTAPAGYTVCSSSLLLLPVCCLPLLPASAEDRLGSGGSRRWRGLDGLTGSRGHGLVPAASSSTGLRGSRVWRASRVDKLHSWRPAVTTYCACFCFDPPCLLIPIFITGS